MKIKKKVTATKHISLDEGVMAQLAHMSRLTNRTASEVISILIEANYEEVVKEYRNG